MILFGAHPLGAEQAGPCARTVSANVVALDQPFFWNRLGAMQPHGMMFALRRDVISKDGSPTLIAGNVKLRDGKRPRPLVLRVNVGDCLRVNFANLLTDFTAASRPSSQLVDPVSGLVQDFGEQPATRNTSVHVIGMQLVGGIASDGSNVGKNPSSLVAPGGSATYTLYAEREGGFLMYGAGATTGGEGDGGSLAAGLFGAVNVEPRGAEWYRSQVTRADMDIAAMPGTVGGGLPVLDYDKLYPVGHAQAGLPVLSMTMKGTAACHPSTEDGCEIVHSDLTAIITGTGRHFWGDATTAEACEQSANGFPRNTTLRNRCEPFREYTIIFHDEIGAIQAFPAVFNDPVLNYTLHGVVDGFAINYGTGGIGSEILANRLAVGPMWNCPECKYEEFFLTSWAVGDAAQVVDIPANVADATGTLITGPKATKVLYPDDPSNVYHSYINDHVKFRNIHAGPKEHHVFHLHSHQWVTTGDSDNSSYLDSQAIGPGASYTYEITYDGSGNRNHTPGDAIFHCHFYPHFAQGMWAMWRNHDVFEWGTQLDASGVPIAGNLWETRALPDGEIATGSPTPGLVPLPGKPMAPMPTATMPGYPYYIPGVPGHRPPQPALDFAKDGSGNDIDGGLPRHVVVNSEADAADLLEGRVAQTPADRDAVALTAGDISGPGNSPWKFIASSSGLSEFPATNRLDFSKESKELNAVELPQAGTPLEQAAMAYHAQRTHSTFLQPRSTTETAASGLFVTNGRPPVPGAPYADPCVDDAGNALGVPILYKGAAFQLDAKYTKTGWHHFQHRMLGLDEDIGNFMTGAKPPEPFFIRANTNHCITYWLTNLLPKNYEMDDFQVRTPTDVMGQHIHLVKFDVTSSDGSGNGYNYEDGSLSPEEVRERIDAINARTGTGGPGIITNATGARTSLVAKEHPFFKNVTAVKSNSWGNLALGAQSTVQRWYSDETEDRRGRDRTLRTVFTHDHFAPSTQQQAGYYAGLVIEPKGSTWKDNATGVALNTRQDGGPTSWQAVIDLTSSSDCGTTCGMSAVDWNNNSTPDWAKTRSYREFMLEYQDMQLAYNKNMTVSGTASPKPVARTITDGVSGVTTTGYFDPNIGRPWVINPPARDEVPLAPGVAGGTVLTVPALQCPTTNATIVAPPCPEAIAADDPGMMTVNYRAEPLALRVADRDPSRPGSPVQATGDAGDLAMAFSSNVTRAIPELNSQPGFYPPLNPGVLPRDPFTPLMRAFSNDKVQIRMLVGAHEEGHNFSIHGQSWLFEPSWGNSGYRNSQMTGISEHFEFDVGEAAVVKPGRKFEDYLYKPGNANDDLWSGTWGLLRIYTDPTAAPDLLKLPNNPSGTTPSAANASQFAGICSNTAAKKSFDLVAVLARDVLPGGAVVYNTGPGGRDILKDPAAMLYVHKTDLGSDGKLKAGVPVEPLVLRVNAGDCISVSLESRLTNPPDTPGYSTYPMIVNRFNANQVAPSSRAGLHVALLKYDIFSGDGMNVGMNPIQTTVAGTPVKYQWYAGDVTICLTRYTKEEHPECFNADGTQKKEGSRVAVPMEYGAVPLMPADPIEQPGKGAVGALVVEPAGATCTTDPGHRTSATCTLPNGTKFRDLVVVFQDAVNLQRVPSGGTATAVKNTAAAEDPEDSGQKGLNYRSEPFWQRLRYEPDCPLNGGHAGAECGNGVTATRDIDYTNVLSNGLVGGDPQTPVFTATPGTQVRFRVVHPGGHGRNHVFQLHGHIWQQLPWIERSAKIGENRELNDPIAGTVKPNGKWLSEWKGSQEGIGPSSHFNLVPQNGAGGKDKVSGDYLFRDQSSFQFDGGIWGILRVCLNGDSGSCQ